MFILKSNLPLPVIIVGALILGLAVGIGVIVSNIKEKKKRRKLIEDIEEATKNQTILSKHYEEIKIGFDKYKYEYINSQFTQAKKHKEKYDLLHKKYPDEIAIKLFNQDYWIGMTIEQLQDAKGQPTKIEEEVLKTKTKRIFIYGNKSSGDVFNFVDGVLERFKDR
jgi:hypothetical protein